MVGTAAAVLGATGIGTNLLGGIFGRRAANSAANAQLRATQAAGERVRQAVGEVNPELKLAAEHGGELVRATAGAGSEAARVAAIQANEGLSPYTATGSTASQALAAGIAPGGDFNRQFTMDDFLIDPGYQFRQEQGELALGRSQAARGGALGGGAVREALRYNSGLASQEFQAAFDRFRNTNKDRFSNLFSLSEQGRAASTTAGDRTINAAQFGAGLETDAAGMAAGMETEAAARRGANTIGGAQTEADLITQGGNAEAAGRVGGSNALWGGITGAADSSVSTYALNRLLRNPALNYFRPMNPAMKPQLLPAYGG